MQVLIRTCNYNFIWDLTRGKPRVASYEGMEGQNEIEADGFDVLMGEGQGHAQNNDCDLDTYILRNLLLHIFQIYFIYLYLL